MVDTKNLSLWAAVLLLIGGLVHLIPALYDGLSGLTGGTPWIQIIVGILSVIVALVMFAGEKPGMGADDRSGVDSPPKPPTNVAGGTGSSSI